MSKLCVVIDVGKTNVKIHVVDDGLVTRFSRSRANKVIDPGSYPHYDIHALWRWIRGSLVEIARDFSIDVISITTHGATAAWVHPDAGESGLVMPVMDYEFDGVASETDYDALRPAFTETYSPALPAGLNLGRQIFWQKRYCQRAFDEARYILPYPQYWAWRLTGVAVSEVTSWGCHSDLWAPGKRDYSSLVDLLGIRAKLPGLVAAGTVIGPISEDLAAQTGLPADCKVIAGLHDSNASFARYLSRPSDRPFTVISTGTWVVSFAPGVPLEALDERRDMLANIDINGNPVACARFMGGREFELICQRTGSKPENAFQVSDLQQLVEDRVIALPDFSEGSGPFGGRRPEIRGRARSGAALATMYSALMMDYELDLLGGAGDLIVEGAWLRNILLCKLLAQLRTQQHTACSSDSTGTVSGAAQLAFGSACGAPPMLDPVNPTRLDGLENYRSYWRQQLSDSSANRC